MHTSPAPQPTDSGHDPARSVIIKGTSIFDSQAGGYKALIDWDEIHHLWIGSTMF
jgi:hypothetical protein